MKGVIDDNGFLHLECEMSMIGATQTGMEIIPAQYDVTFVMHSKDGTEVVELREEQARKLFNFLGVWLLRQSQDR